MPGTRALSARAAASPVAAEAPHRRTPRHPGERPSYIGVRQFRQRRPTAERTPAPRRESSPAGKPKTVRSLTDRVNTNQPEVVTHADAHAHSRKCEDRASGSAAGVPPARNCNPHRKNGRSLENQPETIGRNPSDFAIQETANLQLSKRNICARVN
jgi:hypothetical protein